MQSLESNLQQAFQQLAPVDFVFMLAGALLLVLGRRLYWLAVAGLGFVVAHHFAQEHLIFGSPDARLWASLAFGLAGGLFALMAQKVAVGVAGFVLGGWGTILLLEQLAPDMGLGKILLACVGAMLGLAFSSRVFRAALILITSAVGAVLILRPLHLDPQIEIVSWIVLALVGITAQVGKRRRKAKLED